MQGLEQLLRMWGVSPGSQRWQDMMRDFERGQTLFNQVPHQDHSKDKMTAQEYFAWCRMEYHSTPEGADSEWAALVMACWQDCFLHRAVV